MKRPFSDPVRCDLALALGFAMRSALVSALPVCRHIGLTKAAVEYASRRAAHAAYVILGKHTFESLLHDPDTVPRLAGAMWNSAVEQSDLNGIVLFTPSDKERILSDAKVGCKRVISCAQRALSTGLSFRAMADSQQPTLIPRDWALPSIAVPEDFDPSRWSPKPLVQSLRPLQSFAPFYRVYAKRESAG